MDEKCKTCENQQACIPFFLHEKHIGTATQIKVKQAMYKA